MRRVRLQNSTLLVLTGQPDLTRFLWAKGGGEPNQAELTRFDTPNVKK